MVVMIYLPTYPQTNIYTYQIILGFLNCSVSKEFACNAGDVSSLPGSGRPLGGGNGNPLQ